MQEQQHAPTNTRQHSPDAAPLPQWDSLHTRAQNDRRRPFFFILALLVVLGSVLGVLLSRRATPGAATTGIATATLSPQPFVWQKIQSSTDRLAEEGFAIDRTAHPTMYSCLNQRGTLSVLRSTDGAQTWQNTAPLPAGSYPFCEVAVDPLNGDALLVSGQALTLDGGKAWHQLPYDFSFLVNTIAIYQDAIYLAGHELVVSHDHGNTWTTLITEFNTGSNFPAEPVGVWIDPASGKILIVTATVVNTTLWQSTDQGKTWKVLGKSFAGSYHAFAHTLPSGAWAICLIAGNLGCSSDSAAHWTWAAFLEPMTSLYGTIDDRGDFIGVSNEIFASIYRLDAPTGKWTKLAALPQYTTKNTKIFTSQGRIWLDSFGQIYRATYDVS